MGRFKEGMLSVGAIAGIGAGTHEGLNALAPGAEKGRIEGLAESYKQEAKSNSDGIQGSLNRINRELENSAIPDAVKQKLEVQKQAFELAIKALGGVDSTLQEQK